jgi:REP element-mobilizing transposase RayT
LEMAAALSQLEEEMGVVVGENIPLIETPAAEERPSQVEAMAESDQIPPEEEFGEPAEGQIIPESIPILDESPLAEEELIEAVEPAVAGQEAVFSDEPQSEAPEVLESLATEMMEEHSDVQTVLQEEEIPEVAVSDTRPTQLEKVVETPLEEQVQTEVPIIPVISPPAVTTAEEDIRESIFERRGHTPVGDRFYTVVFAPRESGQFLTGELVEYLGNQLKKTKAGFPWRLTGVAIRPDYLRLSMEISNHLDPTEIISFVKIYTDFAIRQNIPYAEKTIGAANFWAEEHLVITDDSIPEGVQLRDFLKSVKPQPGNPL